MSEHHWIVSARKGRYNKFDQAYEEVEVAVIHTSDTHGRRSYGWPSKTKIIFDDNYSIGKSEFNRLVGLATVLADHLNNKG